MYLLKATPDQVTKHWGLFKFAIAESFPPSNIPTEARLLRILQLVLSGGMQLWIAYRNGYPVKSIGVATTAVYSDLITGTKTLQLFSAYVWDKMDISEWEDGFEILSTYAKSEGCARLELYTTNPRIKEVCEQLGKFQEVSYAIVHLEE